MRRPAWAFLSPGSATQVSLRRGASAGLVPCDNPTRAALTEAACVSERAPQFSTHCFLKRSCVNRWRSLVKERISSQFKATSTGDPLAVSSHPGLVNQWNPGASLTRARFVCNRGSRDCGFTRCLGSVHRNGSSMSAACEGSVRTGCLNNSRDALLP